MRVSTSATRELWRPSSVAALSLGDVRGKRKGFLSLLTTGSLPMDLAKNGTQGCVTRPFDLQWSAMRLVNQLKSCQSGVPCLGAAPTDRVPV